MIGAGGLIALGFTAHDHYLATFPEIIPNNANASALGSLPFIIKNKSTLFSMRNVTLTCWLDRAVFVDDGPRSQIVIPNPLQSIPNIAQQKGITVEPDNFINFPCNEIAALMKLRVHGIEGMRFNAAQVHIDIAYHTRFLIDWNREYHSSKFLRDQATGFTWIAGEVVR